MLVKDGRRVALEDLARNVKVDTRLHVDVKCPCDGLPCDHFIGGAPACFGVTVFGFGQPDTSFLKCSRCHK
jgi:hypothetical protein